ncbi:hypothetical protein AB0O91_12080 [Kitasatospora sp. NPDC089797]|uniref:hypothetical protein n=1 Tax=Kitasatospora sp. NPDC089797 TaxID=3155298 RepID=UPI0034404FA3
MIRRISALLIAAAALLPVGAACVQHASAPAGTADTAVGSTAGGNTAERLEHKG